MKDNVGLLLEQHEPFHWVRSCPHMPVLESTVIKKEKML